MENERVQVMPNGGSFALTEFLNDQGCLRTAPP